MHILLFLEFLLNILETFPYNTWKTLPFNSADTWHSTAYLYHDLFNRCPSDGHGAVSSLPVEDKAWC